jgi:sulfide dehydrogenase [flavocytochrome c] flavoprotein chain
MTVTRRKLLQSSAIGTAVGPISGWSKTGGSKKIVIIGGGFAGASCARALRVYAPDIEVTLVEPKSTYTACPFSNLVIAGVRPLAAQQFHYANIVKSGVSVINAWAQDIEPNTHRVKLSNGDTLLYDRLIMAPGIALDWQGLAGYNAQAAEVLPHAWQAGSQTLLLKRQLTAMADGGLVVISVPQAPYRCPPGPYERASLIASYLKQNKPRAKLLILDAKDNFSKKTLFMQAWHALYGDLIEWQGVSDGARVIEVDAKNKTLITDFDAVRADVANIIPPQQAGLIAQRCGITDATGWCPIEPATFTSTMHPDIHVIGDAAIANAMPKSAFAANAQAKLCAVQAADLLKGKTPRSTTLINTCYSLVDQEYGISVAGVYQPTSDGWQSVPGAGGVSPLEADDNTRRQEAVYARDWFETLTRQVFG